MSDGFVAQDGDNYINILFRTNLGREVSTYKFYFRNGNLAFVYSCTGDYSGQYIQGAYPGYDKMIQNKWLNEGYIPR